MKRLQFTQEQLDKAVSMYKSGHSVTDVAAFLGCSRPTATEHLRAVGMSIRRQPRQRTQTPEHVENEILRAYREGTLVDEIVASAKVSTKTIYNLLKRSGVEVERKTGWTPELREIVVCLHGDGVSPESISSATGISLVSVKRFTAHGRISAFSLIDTEEKAYWLGFITADGSIVGTRPGNLGLQVVLARKDRDHLIKLTEFSQNSRELIDYESLTIAATIPRPYTKFMCQDRALVMDLIRSGVKPNKTGREEPWSGPNHLMRHYWRGMVDGDGSVPGKSFTVTLVGSYEMVSAFVTWASQVSGTGVNPVQDKRSPNHWRALISGKRHVPLLLEALYGNATVALDRKCQRTLEILGQN